MPKSPESDLKAIEVLVKKALEAEGAKNITFTEEPIAFGLKAIMAKFAWIEEKDSTIIEEMIPKIEGVSSMDIVDYRRAFG